MNLYFLLFSSYSRHSVDEKKKAPYIHDLVAKIRHCEKEWRN